MRLPAKPKGGSPRRKKFAMELPPELTRVPVLSLDVLRYMERTGVTSGDTDALAQATGMSIRSMGKAIRGLVTKGYLTMDSDYVYYISDKGRKAMADVAAYDAARAGQPDQRDTRLVEQELVAVLPSPLTANQIATLEAGFPSAPETAGQVILRVSAVGADVSPTQFTLDLTVGQIPAPIRARVTPNGSYRAVRVRIEAVQLIEDTDIHSAGGMFFDVPVAQVGGALKAWYGEVNLQRE